MDLPTKLTPNQIAKRYGVARETVVAWIKSGELAAINVAQPGKQVRYRVDLESLQDFDERRAVGAKKTRRPKRRRRDYPRLV